MSAKGMFEHRFLIAGAAILLLVAAVIAGIYIFTGTDCGTRDCFIEAANACDLATYDRDENGTVYRFTSMSGCSVKKQVVTVSNIEPVEIQVLFNNTEMTCQYEKDGIDPQIIDTLSMGLDACTGSLKESVYTLLIAQYQLDIEEMADTGFYYEDELVMEDLENFS